MPALATKTKQADPLERLLGEDARVVSSRTDVVSNVIEAEWLEVCLPEDEQPEEQGRIYLYALGDGSIALQLCYLQYPDGSDTNAGVTVLKFLPAFFSQYSPAQMLAGQSMKLDDSGEYNFVICAQSRLLLQQMERDHDAAPFMRALLQSEAVMQLLRRAIGNISVPITDSQVPACRFLAYDTERDKIQQAISIIQQHIDRPHTIRELSRKVAMNECYLKKGFKTVTGRTIHEYQQELRITKAKELLAQHGHTVTDVANILGYSSISHFSTAFKRVTGLKPCELLT